MRRITREAFTLSSQRSCVCNSAVSVMMAPMTSEVLGDRLPVLLVLLNRKIHKPEHTEDPSCEYPGKQWPSHGVLRSCVSIRCSMYLARQRSFLCRENGEVLTERGLRIKMPGLYQAEQQRHLPTVRRRADSSSPARQQNFSRSVAGTCQK